MVNCPREYKNIGVESFGNKKKVTEEMLAQFCKNDSWLYGKVKELFDLTDPESRKRHFPPFTNDERSFNIMSATENGTNYYTFNNQTEEVIDIQFKDTVNEGEPLNPDTELDENNLIKNYKDYIDLERSTLAIDPATGRCHIPLETIDINYNTTKVTNTPTTKTVDDYGKVVVDSSYEGPYGKFAPNGTWSACYSFGKTPNIKQAWKKKPYDYKIPTQTLAQTFTAQHSGKLTSVTMNMYEDKKTSYPLRMEIRECDKKGYPTTKILAYTEVKSVKGTSNKNLKLQSFNFKTQPTVKKGKTYAIVLRCPLAPYWACYSVAGWQQMCFNNNAKKALKEARKNGLGYPFVSHNNGYTWLKYNTDKGAGYSNAAKNPVAFGYEVKIKPGTTKKVKSTSATETNVPTTQSIQARQKGTYSLYFKPMRFYKVKRFFGAFDNLQNFDTNYVSVNHMVSNDGKNWYGVGQASNDTSILQEFKNPRDFVYYKITFTLQGNDPSWSYIKVPSDVRSGYYDKDLKYFFNKSTHNDDSKLFVKKGSKFRLVSGSALLNPTSPSEVQKGAFYECVEACPFVLYNYYYDSKTKQFYKESSFSTKILGLDGAIYCDAGHNTKYYECKVTSSENGDIYTYSLISDFNKKFVECYKNGSKFYKSKSGSTYSNEITLKAGVYYRENDTYKIWKCTAVATKSKPNPTVVRSPKYQKIGKYYDANPQTVNDSYLDNPSFGGIRIELDFEKALNAYCRSLDFVPISDEMLPACIWSEANANFSFDKNSNVEMDIVRGIEKVATVSNIGGERFGSSVKLNDYVAYPALKCSFKYDDEFINNEEFNIKDSVSLTTNKIYNSAEQIRKVSIVDKNNYEELAELNGELNSDSIESSILKNFSIEGYYYANNFYADPNHLDVIEAEDGELYKNIAIDGYKEGDKFYDNVDEDARDELTYYAGVYYQDLITLKYYLCSISDSGSVSFTESDQFKQEYYYYDGEKGEFINIDYQTTGKKEWKIDSNYNLVITPTQTNPDLDDKYTDNPFFTGGKNIDVHLNNDYLIKVEFFDNDMVEGIDYTIDYAPQNIGKEEINGEVVKEAIDYNGSVINFFNKEEEKDNFIYSYDTFRNGTLTFTYNPLWVRGLTKEDLPISMDLWIDNYIVNSDGSISKFKYDIYGHVERIETYYEQEEDTYTFYTSVDAVDNLREFLINEETDYQLELIEDKDYTVDYEEKKITVPKSDKINVNDTFTIRYTPDLREFDMSVAFRLTRETVNDDARIYSYYFTTRT